MQSAIALRDGAGAAGIVRFIRHRTAGLQGSGPGGRVEFHDLFAVDKHGIPVRDAAGRIVPKHPDRVVQDVETRNKFTRRGLGRLLHMALYGHGGTYVPAEVTYGQTINPFAAFMLLADETGPPAKPADARPKWNESDGQYDLLIPHGTTVIAEGRRGCLLTDTSGTYFRRVSVSYPTTAPYRELEYVFYAQANTAPRETGVDGLDNFPIKAICIAAALACGYDEASSQVGIHAVLGMPPIWQGITDRVYQHEGAGLHKYLAGETKGTYGDGYVQDSDDGAGHDGSKAFDGDVLDEAISGVPDHGSYWQSGDVSGPHRIGRIWSASKSIKGIRIVIPPGVNSTFSTDDFNIEYLDPAKAPGGDPNNLVPENDTHWTLIQAVANQGITIYDTADRGYEIAFTTPKTCYGIRLSGLYAVDGTRKVYVSELLMYSEPSNFEIKASLSNNVLRVRTDPLLAYRVLTIGDVGPTKLVSDIVTAINRVVRGYELQAVRSDFGFLWLRGTVAGNNSQVDLDSVANGSTANTPLGFASGGGTKTGTTQSVTKLYDDALTITYRCAISGDLPVP